jgi:hypothetical protein
MNSTTISGNLVARFGQHDLEKHTYLLSEINK